MTYHDNGEIVKDKPTWTPLTSKEMRTFETLTHPWAGSRLQEFKFEMGTHNNIKQITKNQ